MLHGWRVLQLLIFFLWCCGPAASRGTHFGKKWYNKQQRRRDVNIGTTTASARHKDWSLYWFIVTASPSVCLRVGRNYDGLVSWWMKMKTCLNGTVFLSKYTVPHTHGHATWEQTRFVIQSRNMLLFFFFFFSCVSWRTGRVRSPPRSQHIYHRLTAPCLSGWVKYAQEDRTRRP